MKRKIVSSNLTLNDYTKASSGFIDDFVHNDYVRPQMVKLSDRDAEKFADGNEWVGAVIERIISDATKLQPKVRLRDKTVEMRPRHRRAIQFVEDFFMRVNPNPESFCSIREKFIKDQLIFNRGTLEKVNTNRGVLQELYALDAKTIEVKSDKHGNVPDKKAFKQKPNRGNDAVFFDKDEIIFQVFRPKSGKIYGTKPLDILANVVASDILRALYNTNFFVNGGEASGIIGLEGMSRGELKKFRQHWRDNHKGASKAHKIIAVNVPIKWVRMAITNRDMEFGEYGKELRNKIFAVYSMQPIVMGVVDGTTGKLNSQEQMELYRDGAIRPILVKEAWAYTTQILWDGFGMYDYEVYFEGIDLAEAKTQTEIDSINLLNASTTVNEVRGTRGLPDVPWGNTPICTAPGGQQVDPETGLLVTPSDNSDDSNGNNSNGNNSNNNDDDKSFDFVDAVVKSIEHLKTKYSLVKTFKMLQDIVIAKDYATNIKQEAVYEGVLKDVCERYKSEATIDLSEIEEYMDNIINKL